MLDPRDVNSKKPEAVELVVVLEIKIIIFEQISILI